MTIELLSQAITVVFYAVVVLFPIAAFFAGRRMNAWKLSVVAGLGGMVLFYMLTVGAFRLHNHWIMDRLNCYETTLDCPEILQIEREELERTLNDKGRDLSYVFLVLFSIPYGLLVSVLTVIARLIQKNYCDRRN